GAVLPKLVENFVHLERGQDRLDEDRCLDAALRHAEQFLRANENIIPEPRFEMMFELGQEEVNAGAVLEAGAGVGKEIESEIKQTARGGLAIHPNVFFRQVPAARTNQQRRNPIIELVLLPLRTG